MENEPGNVASFKLSAAQIETKWLDSLNVEISYRRKTFIYWRTNQFENITIVYREN